MSTVLHPGPAPSARQLILNGIFAENPVFRLALSLCPAVAVTTTVMNGVILGVAVLAVQVLSSVTVAIVRGAIGNSYSSTRPPRTTRSATSSNSGLMSSATVSACAPCWCRS